MKEEVTYWDLGTIDYGECWRLQQELFDALLDAKTAGSFKRAAGPESGLGKKETPERDNVAAGKYINEKGRQYLLLCEHPAVYTLGKSGDKDNMLVGPRFLESKGASFYHIDRGGDITFHGPGQLVGYPILDLEREGIGLRDYIHALEQAVIDTVAEFGISGRRVEGAAGVWLTGGGPERKICAIGVRSSRYVTMHGFALNANTDLRWFEAINPCGFTDRGVTSIERETGLEVDMQNLRQLFAAHFEKILNVKINIEDYANRKALGNQATGRQAQSR